jgi:hypothetical protein
MRWIFVMMVPLAVLAGCPEKNRPVDIDDPTCTSETADYSCLPDLDPVQPPDPDGIPDPDPDPKPPRTHLPESCAGIFFGVHGGCGAPAAGTLTIDGHTTELAWGCASPLLVDDSFMMDEVFYSASFNGMHLSLSPEDSCQPGIYITVIDTERYGDLPALHPLDDKLCDAPELNQGMHNLTVLVRTGDGCLKSPANPYGAFYLESSGTDIFRGHLDTEMVPEKGGDPVPVSLDFSMCHGYAGMTVHMGYDGLCRP